MSDRELLELAAKAVGIDWFDEPALLAGKGLHMKSGPFWDPLADDGDALRLAVKLGITIVPEYPYVIGQSLCRVAWNNRTMSLGEYGDGDPLKATRRAIVRAAASIEKARAAQQQEGDENE